MTVTVKSWAAWVAVAVAVSVSGAGAQTWTGSPNCGANLTCTKVGGTLTVSGAGDMDDFPIDSSGFFIGKGSTAPWGEVYDIVIGKDVTYIGQNAFGSSSLEPYKATVKVNATNPPRVSSGNFTFYYKDSVTLHVPQASINAYKTADKWKDFRYINPSTVTFDAQNGSAPTTKLVSYGDTVAKPNDPVRADYNFDGWYRPSAVGDVVYWDFSTVIRSEIILFAAWKTPTSVLGSNAPKAANIAVRQTGRELKISTPDRAAVRYGVELYSVSGKRQRVSPVYHADGVITVALPHVAAGSYILRVGGGKSGMDRRVLVR